MLWSRLASHSFVYGAELDGADPAKYTPSHTHLTPFLELKTEKEIKSDDDLLKLHQFKLIDWWCQSFLVGEICDGETLGIVQ